MGKRLLLWSVIVAGGCATGGPSRPLAEFPAPDELARIESRPSAAPDLKSAPLPEQGWTVEAASAAVNASTPWTPAGPWDQAFAAAVTSSKRRAQLTRAMACAAEQLGRFYLQHQGTAADLLRQFALAACGAVTPQAGYQSLAVSLGAPATDQQILDHYGVQATRDLLAKLPANVTELGFWSGQANGRWIALVTFAASQVDCKPFSLVPDAAGTVTIEGRLRVEAAQIDAYVNQGQFGVVPCQVDPSVARPQFRVLCPMAPDDQVAWFQVAFAPPRSMLATPILQGLARRDPNKPISLASLSVPGATVAVGGSGGFRNSLVAGLNALRAQAGLRPVRLETAQSDAAERLAGKYFGAALEDRGDEMNTIALGVMAGWQVKGDIRDGSFFSATVPGSGGSAPWLQWALTVPMGRHTLLAPEIDTLAVGSTLFQKPDGAAVLVASYRLHQGNDHSADADALFKRISEARQRAHLSAPVRLPGVNPAITQALDRVKRGEQNTNQALDASLEVAVHRLNRDMRGLAFEAMSIDAVTVPPELLTQATLSLEIGIVHYKPPGAAWAQMVIILIFTSAGGVAA